MVLLVLLVLLLMLLLLLGVGVRVVEVGVGSFVDDSEAVVVKVETICGLTVSDDVVDTTEVEDADISNFSSFRFGIRNWKLERWLYFLKAVGDEAT